MHIQQEHEIGVNFKNNYYNILINHLPMFWDIYIYIYIYIYNKYAYINYESTNSNISIK